MATTTIKTRGAASKIAALDPASATEANLRFRWLILAGLILAAAMEVLDTTIINVALPQMAGNLSTTTQEIAWVSTGYILSNVIVLPMTAFLNTLFGRRNYLTGSIMLFTVASFFCGTAHGLGEIIIWRVLQGVGGAALISTAQATLVQVFPPKEQGIVQPLFLMGLVVFPTLGPTLGGFITDAASWNWCFFINIPIGIIAGSIAFFCLHDTEAAKGDEPVDWAGIGLLAAGLASLQYVLEEGEQDDWFNSAVIVRLTILSAVSLIALVFWQLSPRNTHPVINLRVLEKRLADGGHHFVRRRGFRTLRRELSVSPAGAAASGAVAVAVGLGAAAGGDRDGDQHRLLRRDQQQSQVAVRPARAHALRHRAFRQPECGGWPT